MSLHWHERVRLSATLPRVVANRVKILAALHEAARHGREARSTGLALASRFPELEGIALLLRRRAEELASFERAEEIEEVLETAADHRLEAVFEAVFPPETTLPEDAGSAGWARYFLQLARRNDGRSLRQRIEALGSVRNLELEGGRRTKILGAALEMALKPSEQRHPTTVSCLFTAWVLSDERQLDGPGFEQILEQDPDGFCDGVEALFRMTDRSPWEDRLGSALTDAWKADGPAAAAIRRHLEAWLLYFWPSGLSTEFGASSDEDRVLRAMQLQRLALFMLGHRPELDFLRPLCRYAAAFFRSETTTAWRYGYLAREQAGFLMRWSYSETALPRLAAIAAAPSSTAPEVEAARALAESLWQAELPPALREKPRPPVAEDEKPSRRPPGKRQVQRWHPVEDLIEGRPGLLTALSAEEFLEGNWPWRVAELAGDPSVPDLAPPDLAALKKGLVHVVRSGQVYEDLQVSSANLVYEAWMPWLARLDPQAWMDVLMSLIETGLGYDRPQHLLAQLSVLGVWPAGDLATRLEAAILRATGAGGEILTENWGLLSLIRCAVQLEDRRALERVLEALTHDEDHAKTCELLPIPWVLQWVLDRATFQKAGVRRLEAGQNFERRFWLFIEFYFTAQLTQGEALAWWSRALPTMEVPEKTAPYIAGLLLRIDDDRAAKILMSDARLRALLTHAETQQQILTWARARQCSDRLEELFPGLIENLSLANRGTYLSATGRTEDLRRWGHEVFHVVKELSAEGPALAVGDPLAWSRQALRAWAGLEPESFLKYSRELFSSLEPLFPSLHSTGVVEAILLAWQQLEPLEAQAQRMRLQADWKSFLFRSFSYAGVPVHLHALWDTAGSGGPDHRMLRLQLLGACPSDTEVALHAFAARLNGSIAELDEIADQLLASDAQLDRTLAVSLLAWHPRGEDKLEPLVRHDPSLWVRQHARWARDVARNDRLGRDLYRAALGACTWLEQQAQLQQLVPLVLPSFEIWAYHDQELEESTRALEPRRKALLIDFRYQTRQSIRWDKICGRNLDKYCRGEDLTRHLSTDDPRPPWSSGDVTRTATADPHPAA